MIKIVWLIRLVAMANRNSNKAFTTLQPIVKFRPLPWSQNNRRNGDSTQALNGTTSVFHAWGLGTKQQAHVFMKQVLRATRLVISDGWDGEASWTKIWNDDLIDTPRTLKDHTRLYGESVKTDSDYFDPTNPCFSSSINRFFMVSNVDVVAASADENGRGPLNFASQRQDVSLSQGTLKVLK